eukprot:5925346-Pleurochrysis_carterae.AAC.1
MSDSSSVAPLPEASTSSSSLLPPSPVPTLEEPSSPSHTPTSYWSSSPPRDSYSPPPMPPSLPLSPPASEQGETERPPSQPRAGSARVTRSQTRA